VRVSDAQPPISSDLRNAVIASIRWAWAQIRSDQQIKLMTVDEEQLTNKIEALLNEKRGGQRRASMLRLFGRVERSGQHRASGTSFRQTPDLMFQPRKEPREVTDLSAWGLFTECKVVSPKRNHAVDVWYCEQGVAKFADGRYAPKMSSGIMVAYVRDGRTPYSTLLPLLDDAFSTASVAPHETDMNILTSHHDRTTLTPPCVAIELTHLWLDARSE
jgi:hypothetical protein